MNRKIVAISALTAILAVFSAPVFGATILTVPATFASDALAYVGYLFEDMELILLLIIGLPLAFWAVRRIVALARPR
jgi:hypothetical protein